jgi:hypothetical protein
VLHGLTYMHSLDVVHGDLKAVRISDEDLYARSYTNLRQTFW